MNNQVLQEIEEKDIIQVVIEYDDNELHVWFSHHFLEYYVTCDLEEYYEIIQKYSLNVVYEMRSDINSEGSITDTYPVEIEANIENVQYDKDVICEAFKAGLTVKSYDVQTSNEKLKNLSLELKQMSEALLKKVEQLGKEKGNV